jgi:hypothetical protein
MRDSLGPASLRDIVSALRSIRGEIDEPLPKVLNDQSAWLSGKMLFEKRPDVLGRSLTGTLEQAVAHAHDNTFKLYTSIVAVFYKVN